MAPEGFPGGTSGKELACQSKRCRRLRFNPWVGKIHWRRECILAWRIPWTEEPDRLQSMRSQSVGHDWSNLAHTHSTKPGIKQRVSKSLGMNECYSREKWRQIFLVIHKTSESLQHSHPQSIPTKQWAIILPTTRSSIKKSKMKRK